MKNKVSLLTPSRQRAHLLKDSVESLGKGDFELLIAIDDDDPTREEYEQIPNIKLFITPRYGYANLHEYYNFLAERAKGDWLGLWNDDATMQTERWVSKIAEQNHTIPQVLNVWNPIDNLFPLISRAWYEAVGHFARNTHADSWVQQVADIDGRSVYIPGIDIKHLGEELNDETHTQVRDVVRQTSEAYRRMAEERMEDARRINNWLEEQKNEENN